MLQRIICQVCSAFLSLFFLIPANASADNAPNLEAIPDSIVSISSGYVVTVDKQNQKLYVFKKNGGLTKVFEARCSTGKNHGGKRVSGDAKTPHGIFFATRIIQNPGPPETYGTLAFPLDYPTHADKKAGRNGDNIWIHGTIKPLSPFQSNGCVVLADRDVHALLKFIQINKTPIIISESITWVFQNKRPPVRTELENILTSWHKSYVEGDIKALDALYLEHAKVKGKKRDDLLSRISVIRNANQHFFWEPKDVSILRQASNAVIVFDQITDIKKDSSFEGTYNRLSLEKINNRWVIIDDMEMTASTGKPDKQTPVNGTETLASGNDAIEILITKWVNSWQSGNIAVYRSCYAPGFKSQGKNLDKWIQHKIAIREKSKNISISVEHLNITGGNNEAVAVFTQQYSSSQMTSKGKKQLDLRKINGEWKIVKESMR